MKTFYEQGYRDIDEAYLENKEKFPYHFHCYDSGMITYKKNTFIYTRGRINLKNK